MEIHFEIVDRCLLKCRHCSSLASKRGDKMKYSEQDMVNFLASIKGQKEVFFTGGEPLLYPDLEKMINNIQMQVPNLSLGMFTTGIIKDSERAISISEEYAETLAKCGLKVCYLSVYSHEEKEHDWMTRMQGSFRMLNESMRCLQSAGIEIRFNSVVTAKNIQFYQELIKFAESSGVTEVRMLKLIKHGRAMECWDELGITDEQYRTIVCEVIEKKNKLRITASGAIGILPCRYLYNLEICPAGRQLVYITNEGDIFPCACVKRQKCYRIGNVGDADINEKWRVFQNDLSGVMLCE